jgi:hypothetical protein
LLWFAALQIHAKIQEGEEIAPSVAPEPANLQKCQACGFPVSQGRNLCVECEEKKWRGQKIPVPSPSPKLAPQDQVPVGTVQTAGAESIAPVAVTAEMSEPAIAQAETPKVKREEALSKEARINEATLKESLLKESSTSGELSKELPSMLSDPLPPEDSAPALSLALESESWFAQNKVIVATIFVIIAIVWLR